MFTTPGPARLSSNYSTANLYKPNSRINPKIAEGVYIPKFNM